MSKSDYEHIKQHMDMLSRYDFSFLSLCNLLCRLVVVSGEYLEPCGLDRSFSYLREVEVNEFDIF